MISRTESVSTRIYIYIYTGSVLTLEVGAKLHRYNAEVLHHAFQNENGSARRTYPQNFAYMINDGPDGRG